MHVVESTATRILRRVAADPADLRGLLMESMPLDAVRRRENLVWHCFWARAAFSSELAREHRARHDKLWFRAVADTFTAAQEAGRINADLDAEVEALALMAFVNGVGTAAAFSPRIWSAPKQKAHLDRYLERLT